LDRDEYNDGLCEACRNGDEPMPMGTVVSPEDAAVFDMERAEAEFNRAKAQDSPELVALWGSDVWAEAMRDLYGEWDLLCQITDGLDQLGRPDMVDELQPLIVPLYVKTRRTELTLMNRERNRVNGPPMPHYFAGHYERYKPVDPPAMQSEEEGRRTPYAR